MHQYAKSMRQSIESGESRRGGRIPNIAEKISSHKEFMVLNEDEKELVLKLKMFPTQYLNIKKKLERRFEKTKAVRQSFSSGMDADEGESNSDEIVIYDFLVKHRIINR